MSPGDPARHQVRRPGVLVARRHSVHAPPGPRVHVCIPPDIRLVSVSSPRHPRPHSWRRDPQRGNWEGYLEGKYRPKPLASVTGCQEGRVHAWPGGRCCRSWWRVSRTGRRKTGRTTMILFPLFKHPIPSGCFRAGSRVSHRSGEARPPVSPSPAMKRPGQSISNHHNTRRPRDGQSRDQRAARYYPQAIPMS